MIPRPRPLLVVNGLLALMAASLASGVAWEIGRARVLPPAPLAPARASAPAKPVGSDPAGGTRSVDATMIAAIAAHNLFNAARSDVAAVVAVPTGPKPVLHGVVMDAERSRAYLEDPVAKHIFGYAVGDTVGGGRLERIADDRIVIQRADGPIEIPLQDLAKARPAAPQPPPTPAPAPRPTPAPQTPTEKGSQ